MMLSSSLTTGVTSFSLTVSAVVAASRPTMPIGLIA